MIWVNLMEMKKDMLFLCIDRVFGLISGCRNPGLFFADYRSNTMILREVRSTEEVGGHLKEKEDWHCAIIAEDRDILLRNALAQVLFVFVVRLLVMRLRIVQR
jgi:hypothetical protein